MGWGCHFSDSELTSNLGIMGCVELGLDQAEEAREAAERTRPRRKPLPDSVWGPEGELGAVEGGQLQAYGLLP